MPMIMDDDQFMQHLFDDPGEVQLPAQNLPKGLVSRISELRTTGCCQKIAWSKQGAIASVAPDGRSVGIRVIHRKPKQGKWTLGDETPNVYQLPDDDCRITHLEWSPTGSDLAVVDTSGRVQMFTFAWAFNRLSQLRHIRFPDEEAGGVVGSFWLPRRQAMLFPRATKQGNGWAYLPVQLTSPGPFHPAEDKAAMVYVTRNGTIRLLYQYLDRRWFEISSDLDSISLSSDALTHASLTLDQEGSLFLATHSISDQVRLYKIDIIWGDFATDVQSKTKEPTSTPALNIHHLQVLNEFAPQPQAVGDDISGEYFGPRDTATAQLSHFQLVGSSPKERGGEPTSPFILAVFSQVPYGDISQQHEDMFSVISRWEIQWKGQSSLSPAFQELTTKRTNVSLGAVARKTVQFHRLDDIITNNVILSSQMLNAETLLLITYGDGSIECRDRASMNPLVPTLEPTKVTTLTEAGFSFPVTDPFIYVSLSPCGCGVITSTGDGALQYKPARFTTGSFSAPPRESGVDENAAAAIVALALQHTWAIFHGYSTDDILALIPPDIEPRLSALFLNETFRSLQVNADFTTKENAGKITYLFHSPAFQRYISSVQLFGATEDKNRRIPAKLAYIMLNLRPIISVIAVIVQRPQNVVGLDADYVTSFSGPFRWFMDLMTYILDELSNLMNAISGKEHDRPFVLRTVQESGSPALFLMLCSSTRSLLRATTTSMGTLLGAAQNAAQTPNTLSDEQKLAWSGIMNILGKQSVVNIQHIGTIISAVEQAVQKTYAANKVQDAQRAILEKEMLINARFPDVMMHTIKHLFTNVMDHVLDKVDPAKMYFADTRWLGLHDDVVSRKWVEENKVDVIRKVVLHGNVRLKKCPRCGSIVEDVLPGPGPAWVMQRQQSCICGSGWFLLPLGTDQI